MSPNNTALNVVVDAKPSKRELELMAQLEAARAENTRLSNRPQSKLVVKFQDQPRKDRDTGEMKDPSYAISVYGLGRNPTTLYKEQWERLLDIADDIRACIKLNAPRIPASATKAGKLAAVESPKTTGF